MRIKKSLVFKKVGQKTNATLGWCGLTLLLFVFVLSGCHRDKKDGIVMIERQSVSFVGEEEYDGMELVVDVPVSAPQPLYDSLKLFINNELYNAFESAMDIDFMDETTYFPQKEVFTYDMRNFVASYGEKYGKYMSSLTNLYSLHLLVMSQNDAFITYGLEWYHCGGSCGSELLMYTFSKKDGHRLKNLISVESIVDALKEHHSDYVDSMLACYMECANNKSIQDGNGPISVECGLLDDGLLFATSYHENHYRQWFFPYEEIQGKLSDEARQLVEKIGDSDIPVSDYFLGDRIGVLTSDDGRTIVLTEFPSTHEMVESDGPINDCSSLRAYYVENGNYVPAEIIENNDGFVSKIEVCWDDATCSGVSDNYHDFDTVNKVLYAPYVDNLQMGYHAFRDKYVLYKFDGKHFVYCGENGGYWLHPSIRNYEALICVLDADDEDEIMNNYTIRIDQMVTFDLRDEDQYEASKTDTNIYRYSSWNNEYDMAKQPDMIIDGGYNYNQSFVFPNNEYRYVVDMDDMALKIYRDDKLVKRFKLSFRVVSSNDI